MKKITFLLFACFLFHQLLFSQQISSPEEFLGYEIGARFTRHADVVNYFKDVAENSTLVQFDTYGKTYEGRPLTYAIVSSEENLKNLESIRNSHLINSGLKDGNTNNTDVAVVWLSYNVHGNEASSTEASMQTLYELITQKQEWLKNTIVIIDPCVNPDGRDRYVNWYNQVKTNPYSASETAAEHNEPWPGGRPNHYLFDLNRDWAWATQIETRERLKLYNQWMPHIHVDFHEQEINSPYYFAPAAEPFHEIITPFQKDFQTEIGKNHAKYFDKKGWLYFTGERFDLLYPSYGDTYPTYMGAIGMTYEQAGNGDAGLGINTQQGYELTLKDRVAHHLTTGLSTVEMASANEEKLQQEFRKYFQNDDLKTKSYVLKGNPDKIKELEKVLDRHEIKYSEGTTDKIKGTSYSQNSSNSDDGSLIINTNQPKGKMVNVLFEPSAKLNDSLTYDITAWSLPYAYGLQANASSSQIKVQNSSSEKMANKQDGSSAGYISKWNSMEDAKFLAALLKNDIRVRFSSVPFETANKKFDRGSLVITRSDNFKNESFDSLVVSLANKFDRNLTAATTGFSTSGPDFGSGDMKIINNPKIGLLRGSGTSSLNFGETWYFFEQDLNYPILPVETGDLSRIDLNTLDVLIMPSGYYSSVLTEDVMTKITAWVKQGGKLIAIGNAVGSFADKEGFSLKKNTEKKDDSIVKIIPYNMQEREGIKDLITGSIVQTYLDNTHPLAYGYDNSYFSLKLGDDSYSYLKDGYTVGYLKDNVEIVSGFAGSNAKEKIKNSLTFGEEPMGRGSFIYFVDNPLFRSFWQNGKLFIANSIFMVNNSELEVSR